MPGRCPLAGVTGWGPAHWYRDGTSAVYSRPSELRNEVRVQGWGRVHLWELAHVLVCFLSEGEASVTSSAEKVTTEVGEQGATSPGSVAGRVD